MKGALSNHLCTCYICYYVVTYVASAEVVGKCTFQSSSNCYATDNIISRNAKLNLTVLVDLHKLKYTTLVITELNSAN